MAPPMSSVSGAAPIRRRRRSTTSSVPASLSMKSTGASHFRAPRAAVSRSGPCAYWVNISTGSLGQRRTIWPKMPKPLKRSSRWSPKRTSSSTASGRRSSMPHSAAASNSSPREPPRAGCTTLALQPSCSRRRRTVRRMGDSASSSTIIMVGVARFAAISSLSPPASPRRTTGLF